ncbi:HAMP domain-containing histidine kinase [Candidatus Poribacteria bacterium]|nr:HAMP domain-containing histidine kinase [Candidatus Poribacteria bacterium]MBT5535758.1 HAMP domain-containing histidine kinase [Candidatus Poribacteria bacterium]MBT5714533.1 HAMP domain-containing histidine kinase [Candidatus Poribacteria bacterium]MBT7098722.1 HAMP domain-containing histidine kinase [Candidatus Poribacteria bacterium]MBT7807275.1 HAMP domain-containing histidine kinase [Candidatus Poribacteria bacterium]
MRLPLQAKATLGIALLVAAALAVSSWLAYFTARGALHGEMEARITAVAQMAAAQFDADFLAVIEPGQEDTRLHRSYRAKLREIQAATDARRIYIFTPEGRSLADSQDDVPIGASYRFLSANRVHVDEALSGAPAASVAFHGEDGTYYRSAFAAVTDREGRAVAVLGVDAGVLFLGTLTTMQRTMLLIGALSTLLATALGVLYVRAIVTPIRRLSQAAREIMHGTFGATVEVTRGDEIGVLGRTFNEMSVALAERDRRVSRFAEELRQMSAGLAHEIRNPLNGMRLFLGLLQRRVADEEATGIIEKVDGEVQALDGLVTEFLNFARPSTPAWEEARVADIVTDALGLSQADIDAAGVRVNSDVPASLTVEADARELQRALLNLIGNAVHAMPTGGDLSIAARSDIEHRAVVVDIADTGVGMSTETAERAFDPFYTTKDHGTGLGLALVRRIVERHGGSIRCVGVEGEGSTFTITLPIRQEND